MTGRTVNKEQGLLTSMSQTLINDNNEMAQDIMEIARNGFNAVLIIGREIISPTDLLASNEAIAKRAAAIHQVKAVYSEIVTRLGGNPILKTEANSSRFEDNGTLILEDIEEVYTINSVPDHITNADSNINLQSDDRFERLDLFINSLKRGTNFPSVAIFITSDPVRAIRFLRNGTTTKRGVRSLAAFVDEGVSTRNVPYVGSNLDTDYSINLFLQSLKSAIIEESGASRVDSLIDGRD